MSETEDRLRLQGRLTASEVAELDRRYRGRFDRDSAPTTIDLSGVDSGDSSALALLLEWQALAAGRGRRIRFEQPPESLRVIADLTGVASLLGWESDNTGPTPDRRENAS